jgi:hypothetical protein
MTTRKLTIAVLSAGVAVTLAACGAGAASHVVKGATPQSTSPVVTTGSSTTTPVAGSPTTTPSNGLDQHTLDQVAAELGSLDNSLNAANSDLNNPQGDS